MSSQRLWQVFRMHSVRRRWKRSRALFVQTDHQVLLMWVKCTRQCAANQCVVVQLLWQKDFTHFVSATLVMILFSVLFCVCLFVFEQHNFNLWADLQEIWDMDTGQEVTSWLICFCLFFVGCRSGVRCKWFAYELASATPTFLLCQLTQVVLEKEAVKKNVAVGKHVDYRPLKSWLKCWKYIVTVKVSVNNTHVGSVHSTGYSVV